jgi:chromate reductase
LVKLSTGQAWYDPSTRLLSMSPRPADSDSGKPHDTLAAYDCIFGPFRALCAQTEDTKMAYRIAVIVGSLRRDSTNRQLAKALTSLAPSDFSFDFVDIGSLPLYSQDYDAEFPAVAVEFKKKIEAADGLLFVTPEYNRSMPGVLKNALDWGSRPWGKSVWGNKPGAVAGTSPGATGTALAQQHLRNVLAYLDVATLGQPEMFIKHSTAAIDETGEIVNDHTRKFLQSFVERYVAWVKTHGGTR